MTLFRSLLCAAPCALGLLASAPAFSEEAALLGDLSGKSPTTLTAAELKDLMPGAKMKRITTKGNTQLWSNDNNGSFVISSDNRDRVSARPSTANGKWHLSDDGRYCVLIEWKSVETEEWCRYIIKTSDGSYYTAKGDKLGGEKVYKVEIGK